MKKYFLKKYCGFAVVVVGIMVAVSIGAGIYNIPVNRLQRQLDLGYKYLEEQQYEEACIAFEQAIAIDECCVEAYANGIKAYQSVGDKENLKVIYDRAVDMLDALDEVIIAENMVYVVDIYLTVDAVYGGDKEKISQILEEGYRLTGENTDIRNMLVKNYIEVAKEGSGKGDYEGSLTVYDRLLELDSTNEVVISDLCVCLNQYLDILMEAKRYEEIRVLAEKYKTIAVNVDFAFILTSLVELERIDAENRSFMQKVYDLMEAEDYEGLCEIDGSEEAIAFVERMENDCYIFFPDNNFSLSGVGAAIYKNDNFFYYGNFEEGIRKGFGILLYGNGEYEGYHLFTGMWDMDMPNGEGIEEHYVYDYKSNSISGEFTHEIHKGILTNGIWEGQVDVKLVRNGEVYDLSFYAEDGIPLEDKVGEAMFIESGFTPGGNYDYCYAHDYHQNTDSMWGIYRTSEEKIGVFGFGFEGYTIGGY